MRDGAARQGPPGRPTIPAEAAAGVRLDSPADVYAETTAAVLLLVGERGPAYLARAAEALARTIPRSQLRTLPKLGHDGPQQAPERVAAELRGFFDAGPLA